MDMIYKVSLDVLDNCIFRNNHADRNGGAVAVVTTGNMQNWLDTIPDKSHQIISNMNISSGQFTGNSVGQNLVPWTESGKHDFGGAIYLSHTNLNIGITDNQSQSVFVASNSAEKGGAIAVNGANLNLLSGEVGALGNPNIASVGGAIYLDGGNATIDNGKIQYNTSSLFGGGIYVNDGNFICNSGLIQSNTVDGGNGGGLYVSGGDVQIKGGEIYYNKALKTIAGGNGGAVYLSGGTFTVSGDARIHHNSADYYGGAAYINGGTTNFTTTTAYIESNDAVLGGGLYVNGGNITFKGNLVGNTAVNGGGLYLGPGASMDFQGGLIINNQANMPDGATSAGTAYHGSSPNIMGCGGGVYLQNGSSSKKTTLTFNLDPLDKTFGLYTNMAGDDLVAEGQYTEVVLPSVREMQLYGFEGKDAVPFWYQDYFTDDTGYNQENGHAVTNNVNYIGRFREMLNLFTNEYYNHRIPDDATNLNNIKNNYLCLTLSYNMLDITISAKYLLGHETAMFRLVRHGSTDDVHYDVLLRGDRTDSATGKSSRTLRNMPWGTYSIYPNDAWNWAYEKIAPQQNLRLGETGNYEFLFDMQHINGAEVPQHDERQPGEPDGK